MSGQGFLESTSASIDTGSATITLRGYIDCSHVSSGTAIFLNNGQTLVEGLRGTAPETSTGTSTITLRKKWTGASLTNVSLTAFNTIEGLRDAIRRAREIAEKGGGDGGMTKTFGDFITSTDETMTMTISGAKVTTTPYGFLLPAVTNLLKKVNNGTFMDGGTY